MTKVKQKIPEGWSVKKLGEVCDVRDGTHESPKFHSTGFPLITSKNLTAGTINFDNVQYISEIDHVNICKRSNVDDGDILLAMIGTIGNPVLVKKVRDFSIKNVALFKVGNRNNCINNNYLNNCLQYFSSDLNKKSAGGTQKFVGLTFLRNYKICLPPLSEQKKIAEILGTWDEGIEKLSDLIGLKEKQKKSLMQKLFKVKPDWQFHRFDKIFTNYCKKNCPSERLLSATQDRGVIPRDMLEGRVMSPEGSLSGYKLINDGEFVVSLRSFQGGIEYSRYKGILSPAYTVLRNLIEIDKNFYRYFFKSYIFIEKYLSMAVIGIRDGKQISYPDLCSVKIPYPSLTLQKAIAEVLSTADDEINFLKQKFTALKEQKKGLMQQLLTGKVRVKVN